MGDNEKHTRPRLAHLGLLVVLPAIAGCPIIQESRSDTVEHPGTITMLTYTGTTTYYETSDGPAGFEYDLAKAFADRVGLELRVVVADKYADVLPRLLKGEADFAAASIPAAEGRDDIRFTPWYKKIRQHVVYRLGNQRPNRIDELIGRDIEVQAGTIHAERLHALKRAHPELEWSEVSGRRPEELLELVWEGLLDLTVADANLFAVNRLYYPELQIAFTLPSEQPLAWAFPATGGDSLYKAAAKFLEAQRRSGTIAHLIERYYGPANKSNYINLAAFRGRIYSRLPLYQQYLEEAGQRYNLDWRLLAALAYQESYWDPHIESPTGVRGFMMLTRLTATELGIKDRLNVEASIDGGARYLRTLLDRLPERIEHPDRVWFALAGYNAGASRVEAARVLTERQGGDPDKWIDVKERLPQLSDPAEDRMKWGYFRGDEPVRFVNRVRVYYDVLVKLDEDEKARRTAQARETDEDEKTGRTAQVFKLTVRAL